MKNLIKKYFLTIIKEHKGRGGTREYFMYPSKDFEKLDHKSAIKHENRGPRPPHRFFHYSKYPSQQNLKISVHLC